jgi:hypothetical protein
MNIRTFFHTVGAAVLVASSLGAGTALADQPAPERTPTVVTEGQTRITTGKAAYEAGESIIIRYTLPGRGYIRILDYQGAKVSTLSSGYRARAYGSIRGIVTPPYGKECLTLEYSPYRPLPAMPPGRDLVRNDPSGQSGQGPAYAETCFEVRAPEKRDVLGGEA